MFNFDVKACNLMFLPTTNQFFWILSCMTLKNVSSISDCDAFGVISSISDVIKPIT